MRHGRWFRSFLFGLFGLFGLFSSFLVPTLAGGTARADLQPGFQAPPDTLGLTPVAQIVPGGQGGFIDDPMAFDGSGNRLAYVRTDASSFCQLVIFDVTEQAETGYVDLTPFTLSPERVVWLPGDRLAVVAHDPDAPQKTLGIFDLASAKQVETLGPDQDFGFPRAADGTVELLSFDQADATGGGTSYTINQFSTTVFAPKPAPVHKVPLTADGEGLIASLQLKVLFWTDGYGLLVAREKGGYDKAQDVRLPDQAATYDVLLGKVVSDHAIQDVIGYSKLVIVRQAHPLVSTFLTFNEDLNGLGLVRSDDSQATVDTQLPLALYDAKSLQQQPADGSTARVCFSLTIDPVNPQAVARQKADKDLIDFYAMDVSPAGGDHASATLLGRVPASGKPFAWTTGSTNVALLRKHIGFDRGGSAIEVYGLPTGPVAVTQAEIPAHP
jgi:hypothetical protein